MSDGETDRLLNLLRKMVDESGRTQRDLERALDLGHGYLSHLFAGRIDLKFKHIYLLGSELGFSPADFFLRAYSLVRPGTTLPPEGVEGRTRTGIELTPPPLVPPDRYVVKDMLRELLAEMLLREDHAREAPARGDDREDEERPPARRRRAS